MARGLQLFKASQTQVQAAQQSNTESHCLKEIHQPLHNTEIMEHLNRRRYERLQRVKMILFTFSLIFGSLFLAAVLGYWFFSLDVPTGHIYFHDLYVHISFNTSRFFELRSGPKHSDLLLLQGSLGLSIPKVTPFKTLTKNASHIHIKWNPYAELLLLYSENAKGASTCYEFIWKGHGGVLRNRLEDCIELGNARWYGSFMNGNKVMHQTDSGEKNSWPWGQDLHQEAWQDFDSLATIDGDIVLERHWFSSNGVGIHVSTDIPLKARLTKRQDMVNLCFKAAHKNHSKHVLHNPYPPLYLSYSICKSPDIKAAYDSMLQRYDAYPKNSVAQSPLFQRTIWSLPNYHINTKNGSPAIVQSFAKQVLDSGYYKSGIMIDIEKFMENALKSPDADTNKQESTLLMPKRLSFVLKEISGMGFCLIIKIPFANLLHYSIAAEVSYQSNKCNIECVNLYDETAIGIFKSHMLSVVNELKRQYDICSFMLDMQVPSSKGHGVTSPIFQNIAKYLLNSMSTCCPNTISNMAFGLQNASLFIKMKDISPNWSHTTGLNSVIRNALTLSILGYPFIIPPGFTRPRHITATNVTTAETSKLPLPDPELFVRWFQLVSVFPVASFSVSPWMYQDNNVSHAIKEAIKTRNQFLPIILQLVKKAELGQPILRPLWWLEPNNKKLQAIEDEFLIGDGILVAPVLSPGIQNRDILFPSGYWRDDRLSMTLKGGQWYHKYEVSLNHMPYFFQVKES